MHNWNKIIVATIEVTFNASWNKLLIKYSIDIYKYINRMWIVYKKCFILA